MINKTRMGFYEVKLKIANMRNAQEFTLYPDLENNTAFLQSEKRFILVNLLTGKGLVTPKNREYPRPHDASLVFAADSELIEALKTHYANHKVGTNEFKSGNTVILTY